MGTTGKFGTGNTRPAVLKLFTERWKGMENVKCEGCKFSGNCYQEECYAVIKTKCNDYEEVGKDDEL